MHFDCFNLSICNMSFVDAWDCGVNDTFGGGAAKYLQREMKFMAACQIEFVCRSLVRTLMERRPERLFDLAY